MTLPFAEWLPQQRWYAGRTRTLSSVKQASSTALDDDLVALGAAVLVRGVDEHQVEVVAQRRHR